MRMGRITRAGQLSVPAEIRRRWGASRILIEDRGDHIVLRPVPEDPIAAARGALKGKMRGLSSDELRRAAREDEARAEERKARLYGWK
jgi:AbrB family looped-hinge helix DNA binding protein